MSALHAPPLELFEADRLIEGGGNRPLPLDTEFKAYEVVRGYVDIFALDRDSDARRHLFRLEQGARLFSVPPSHHGSLIALGGLGSQFRPLGTSAWQLAQTREWVRSLSEAMSAARQWPTHLLEKETVHLSPGETCSSPADMTVLAQTDRGQVSWDGIAISEGAMFALAAPGLLRAETEVTIAVVSDPQLFDVQSALEGLTHLALELAHAAFLAERQAAQSVIEGKEDATSKRVSDALGALRHGTRAQRAVTNPWFAAIEAVLDAFGHSEEDVPEAVRRRAKEALAFEPILKDFLLNYRDVRLTGRWWRRDGLPMLGYTNAGEPIALLPDGRGRFAAVGPSGSQTVNASVAQTIASRALQVYPMLESRSLSFRDLFRFARTGLSGDIRRIIATSLLNAAAVAAIPIATGILFDSIVPLNDRSGLVGVAVLLVAVALGQSLFELTRAMSVARMESVLDAKLQAAIMLRLLRLPAKFFQGFSVGDLGQRALGLQEVRQVMTASALSGLFGIVGALSSMVAMLFISWRLALAAFVPLAIMIAASSLISRRQLRYERDRVRLNGQLDGFLLQVLIGLPKLRAAAAEMRAFAEWIWRSMPERKAFGMARKYSGWQTVIGAVLPSLSLLFIFACLLLVFKYEQTLAALAALVDPAEGTTTPSLSAGMFVAFVTAFGQASAALVAAATAVSEIMSIGPLVERTLPLIQAEPETTRQREAPGRLMGEIAFNRVHFRYGADGPLVLKDVSFTIHPGEYVAIVGESGSGKSTILRLLLGFDVPEEGAVFFDGKPAERLDTAALRAEIGVVLQNGRISPGSVYQNIAGASGRGMEAAWAAARLVALAPDIEAMPMGMHTVLSDGGGTLSGGQRQRILLARALVNEPNILLMDEATSALDNRTQRVVTETLARLAVTRIVIAHRLSTIQNVDRIVVMEKGRLVESGSYEELMAARGAFFALARRQLIEKES